MPSTSPLAGELLCTLTAEPTANMAHAAATATHGGG
eukprot:CAMPEP_0198544790 /NCGR_PEP_ID=MMETSP1462-20131121/61917_1 /TAXON_ID=1333877 /ORGANISM="Brandtodinium nutriculum, Strain RCC3387" /LENGTH=35 /DNA_ID= /DNA_START= /DNA_END= /DNA_ORIENTATION=